MTRSCWFSSVSLLVLMAVQPALPTLAAASAGPDPRGLEARLSELSSSIGQLNAVNCGPDARALAAELDAVKLPHLNARTYASALSARAALRQALLRLADAGLLDRECALALRSAMRSMRELEDLALENDQAHGRAPKAKSKAFQDGYPYTVIWTGGEPAMRGDAQGADSRAGIRDALPALRSGDVLLSRGKFATSAAISKIADEESSFSHLALVRVDPRTGKVWTIEAHAEQGMVIAPLEKYRTDGKARSVLLRFRGSSELAADAAERMFQKVKAAGNGKYVYDFKLDPTDHSTIFCSEVISWGFEEASQGQVRLPLFPSSLSQLSDPYRAKIGIPALQAFLPGDLELDPRFELLAEWRDGTQLRDNRHRDVILATYYQWMKKNGGLQMKPTLMGAMVRSWVTRVRERPLLGRLLEDRFPPHIPKGFLEAAFVLELLAEDAAEALAKWDPAEKPARSQAELRAFAARRLTHLPVISDYFMAAEQ